MSPDCSNATLVCAHLQKSARALGLLPRNAPFGEDNNGTAVASTHEFTRNAEAAGINFNPGDFIGAEVVQDVSVDRSLPVNENVCIAKWLSHYRGSELDFVRSDKC